MFEIKPRTPEELRALKLEHLQKVQEGIANATRRGKKFPNVRYELTVSAVELKTGESVDCLHLLWHGSASTVPTDLMREVDYLVCRDDEGYTVAKNRFEPPGARVMV